MFIHIERSMGFGDARHHQNLILEIMGKFLRFDNFYRSKIWSNLAYVGPAEKVKKGKSSKFNLKNEGQVKSSPAIHLVTKRGFYRLKTQNTLEMQTHNILRKLPSKLLKMDCLFLSILGPDLVLRRGVRRF